MKKQIVVPQSMRAEVMKECHDSPMAGHQGLFKTLLRARTHYWWPRMWSDIDKYVSGCLVCQQVKMPKGQTRQGRSRSFFATYPWETIQADAIMGLPTTARGNNSIVKCMDLFTRSHEMRPSKGARPEDWVAF